ncbi:putative polysaccharide biosynthesis protein [Alkaliphilus peptidifermentans]|uniref:Stage V sporulation protein B n=1 Tax=Alkaliphilus peptidifermentans DSM 18978 TaxID=1120976 RepID=A0A1G5AKS8_9FIRM|nr:polysaccharide biosynthesis protein [Alkaliphilus peptidifermentans]SCX78492.1 stage V sporulation protein B [Alkaliphilus peptidifermentans DSM 18978]
MKKDSFLKGAAILGIAGIMVKILGAFFRIPLGNIIGSEGFGYYQVGYPIFTFLLSFSIAGFPTAISKLVSEKRAKGNYVGAHQVFKISILVLLGIGSVSAIILYLGAGFFVNNIVKSPNAYYAVLALAPGLFFVSMQAGFRGYFQGMKNMVPTAISQFVEQLARVIVGLGLAVVLLRQNVEYAAAGASFGATAGGIAGLSVILYIYFNDRKKKSALNQQMEGQKDPVGKVITELMHIAIPITIGASILPLINMIDSLIVLRRLQAIGFTYAEANSLFGQLTGMAVTLINLPQVLTVALSMSIVPVIAEARAKKDWEGVRNDIQSGLRVSFLIGLPSAVGLAVLATPIMQLLFPREPASIGQILLYLSFAVLFLTQVQVMTGILQGLGKQIIPVRNLMIGAAFKLVATYILTGIPALNVKGAALGTVLAYLIAAILNLMAVRKYTKVTFNMRRMFYKPIVAVTVMAIATRISYSQFSRILGGRLATVVAIGIGGLVYGGMLLYTSTITEEDFELIPGGTKIVKILSKLGVMR